jgi:hypothetical protein
MKDSTDIWLIVIGSLIVILLLFVLSSPARAHDDGIWKDADTYKSEGSGRCGMGYVLSYTGEQTWQPYLYAGHWHMTEWVMPTPNCKLFFIKLEGEDNNGDDQ